MSPGYNNLLYMAHAFKLRSIYPSPIKRVPTHTSGYKDFLQAAVRQTADLQGLIPDEMSCRRRSWRQDTYATATVESVTRIVSLRTLTSDLQYATVAHNITINWLIFLLLFSIPVKCNSFSARLQHGHIVVTNYVCVKI